MRLLSRGPRRRTRPAGSTPPAASPARQALAHARELIHSLRWHRQLDARAWGLEAYDTLRQNTRAQRRRGRADPPGGGRGGGGGARARAYTPPYGWRGRTSGAIPAVCPSRCGTCAWPCATTMSSPAPPRQEEGQFRQDCPGRAGACVDAWVHAWYVQAGGEWAHVGNVAGSALHGLVHHPVHVVHHVRHVEQVFQITHLHPRRCAVKSVAHIRPGRQIQREAVGGAPAPPGHHFGDGALCSFTLDRAP